MSLISPEQRREVLARQVSTLIAQGRRVETQDDYQAVLVRGRGSLERRELITVDDFGNPRVERLPFEKDRLIIQVAFVLAVLVLIILGLIFGGDDGSAERPLVWLGRPEVLRLG
jgi:hypothetical protein